MCRLWQGKPQDHEVSSDLLHQSLNVLDLGVSHAGTAEDLFTAFGDGFVCLCLNILPVGKQLHRPEQGALGSVGSSHHAKTNTE